MRKPPEEISRKVREVRKVLKNAKEMEGGWRAGVRKPPEENSRKVREVRKVIDW